ncbi:MAG: four helix bundle protein [Planctomycetota bacterium]|nr:four helix bundle protein [Planctomycetota bacterium]
MPFEALEVSLELVRSLRQPLRRLESCDPRLSRQLRDAASSVALNLAEGRRRAGRDRRHL